MDPIHLRPAELDYELKIRGIFGISNTRRKTTIMREHLRKELEGLEAAPVTSSGQYLIEDELKTCSEILAEINIIVMDQAQRANSLFRAEVANRLIHVTGRLNRLTPKTDKNETDLNLLKKTCDDMQKILRASELDNGQMQREDEVALSRADRRQSQLIVPRLSASRPSSIELMGRTISDVEQPIPTQVRHSWLSAASTGLPAYTPYASDKQTDDLFDQRGCHQQADDIFAMTGCDEDICELGAVGGSSLNPKAKDFRPSITAFGAGIEVEVPGRTTRVLNERLNERERRDEEGRLDRRTTSRVSRESPQLLGYPRPTDKRLNEFEFAAERRDEDGRLDRRTIQRVSSESHQRFEYTRPSDNRLNELEFADERRDVVGSDDRRRDNQTFTYEHMRDPPTDENMTHLRDNTNYEREYVPRSAGLERMTLSQYRGRNDDDRLDRIRCPLRSERAPNRLDRENIRYDEELLSSRDRSRCPVRVIGNNDPHNDRPHFPRASAYNGDDRPECGRPRLTSRPMRKSVPVNQWRITFSGDGRGLHLYDFLSQVSLFQRSEMISDEELMYSLVHLLNGRARQWYASLGDSIDSWEEMIEALKDEFLPLDYDYHLLNDISTRRQKTTESFGEYITLMKSLFRWLNVPIAEAHKVFIVRKNLLPRYSMGVAANNLRTLRELTEVCRRIDSATAAAAPSRTAGLPFENSSYYPNVGTRNTSAPRTAQVAEVNCEYDVDDQFCGSEICALRRGQGQGNSGAYKCYNCQKDGHVFRSCPAPREGIFCYNCGGKDVTVKNCGKCASGNAGRDQENRTSQLGPENLTSGTAASASAVPKL